MPRRTQRYSKIGDTMKTIDLSGKWNYKTERKGERDGFFSDR